MCKEGAVFDMVSEPVGGRVRLLQVVGGRADCPEWDRVLVPVVGRVRGMTILSAMVPTRESGWRDVDRTSSEGRMKDADSIVVSNMESIPNSSSRKNLESSSSATWPIGRMFHCGVVE